MRHDGIGLLGKAKKIPAERRPMLAIAVTSRLAF
jgi:hypothetical protein